MSNETTPAQIPIAEGIAGARGPVIRFAGNRERLKAIKLEFPLEVDGVIVDTINVRRLTAGEVAAFVEVMQADPAARHRWPMADQPDHVIDALDADDGYAVNRAITDFLPQQFRAEAPE